MKTTHACLTPYKLCGLCRNLGLHTDQCRLRAEERGVASRLRSSSASTSPDAVVGMDSNPIAAWRRCRNIERVCEDASCIFPLSRNFQNEPNTTVVFLH